MYATTSTVVVGDAGACLLVDPGVTSGELDGLAAELAARGLRPVARWATHGHWDHLLTTEAWADLPAWWGGPPVGPPSGSAPRAGEGSTGSAGSVDGWRDAVAAERDADLELAVIAPDDRPSVLPGPPLVRTVGADGLEISWPGPRAVAIATPGHAPDHTSLWLPGTRVLVAGDLLSDTEVPLLDPASRPGLDQYRATLDALESLDALVVVPGHGSVATGAAVALRFADDRAYLRELVAGRDPDDPRLATAWVAAEHAAQRAALGG